MWRMWRVIGGQGEEFQLLNDVVDATNRFTMTAFILSCFRIDAVSLNMHHEVRPFARLRFATSKRGDSRGPSAKFKLRSSATHRLPNMEQNTAHDPSRHADCGTCPYQWHLAHDLRIKSCVQLQVCTSSQTDRLIRQNVDGLRRASSLLGTNIVLLKQTFQTYARV